MYPVSKRRKENRHAHFKNNTTFYNHQPLQHVQLTHNNYDNLMQKQLGDEQLRQIGQNSGVSKLHTGDIPLQKLFTYNGGANQELSGGLYNSNEES